MVTFAGDNANGEPSAYPSTPPGLATTILGGDPCHSGELEMAEISDQKAHSVLFSHLQPQASIARATRVLPCFT